MKRFYCLLLIITMFLSGCSTMGEWIKEPVVFYYVHEDYQQDMEHVIASELREASGHREDLSYLLALYSMGPSKEGLESPFPSNTVMLPIEHSGGKLVLNLSDNMLTLTDSEYTLAGACIALTCMEITDVDIVTLVCGEKSITIEKDTLMLHSDPMYQQEETA